MDQQANSRDMGRRNARVALLCAGFAACMVGAAYAAVPLYQLFCQVTGFAGTTQRAEAASDTVLDQTITVRFDANTAGIHWRFKPELREVTLRIGETGFVNYVAENLSDDATVGTSTFNVSPPQAGIFFNKLDCFCFTEQELKAGETAKLGVQFFVDPDIVKEPGLNELKEITLSYTFYPSTEEAALEDEGNPES